MTEQTFFRLLNIIGLLIILNLGSGCREKIVIPEPIYPNGEIIGPDGPEPMRGWEVVRKSGQIGPVDYYNTGGPWYISLEMPELLDTKYTQLYLNPNVYERGLDGWFLTKTFTVNDRFLHIFDPSKDYHRWYYVVFIYTDYVPEE